VTGQVVVSQTFKIALIDFVKDQLKKTWHQGHLKRELYKVIVHKVVEIVVHSTKSFRNMSQNANKYLQDSRVKINKLIRVCPDPPTSLPSSHNVTETEKTCCAYTRLCCMQYYLGKHKVEYLE
jgi:hypothetical protein